MRMVLSAQLCMCARAMLWRHVWNYTCDQQRTVSPGASVRVLACCVCLWGGVRRRELLPIPCFPAGPEPPGALAPASPI